MKTLGLLFSLILLFIFGLSLIFIGFVSRCFAWDSAVLHVVPALMVYAILRSVGGRLDRQYKRSIQEFIDGKADKIVLKKGLLRVFSFLLITLLPFLLYLQLLSLLLAISFVLYFMLLLDYLPAVPVVVYLGLLIVLLGTLIGILIGFYRLFFPPKHQQYGIEIGKEENLFWEVVHDVADKVGAKPVHHVYVTPGAGICVYQDGSLFRSIIGRGKRVLEIGLPVLNDVTVDEFKSILAHEYGHFSHRDTQWGWFTYALSSSLISTLHSIPGPMAGEGRGSVIGIIMFLNPAYWSLLLFTKMFFRITNGFSRVREVMADTTAMELYGGKALKDGLFKISVNGSLLGKHLPACAAELSREGKYFTHFDEFIQSAFARVGEPEREEIVTKVLEEGEKQDEFDSHPALKVRMDYAERFGGEIKENIQPVKALFETWDSVNSRIADLFNSGKAAFVERMPEEDASRTDDGETTQCIEIKKAFEKPVAFVLDSDCDVKNRLGKSEGVMRLIADSVQAEGLMPFVEKTPDVVDDTLVRFVENSMPNGRKHRNLTVRAIRSLAVRASEFCEECANCPSNVTGRGLGCAGAIRFISGCAEEWLMDLLPTEIEGNDRGEVLKKIAKSSVKAAKAVDAARISGRYEFKESLIDEWGKVPIGKIECTSSMILGSLYHADKVTPDHAARMCYLLGATNALPKPGKPESAKWILDINTLPDDPSVREIAWMLRAFYQGCILNRDVIVSQ